MSEPIYEPGPSPAPVTYEASGTSPIVALACYAEFDGTSALTDYKPALKFTSQAGHTFMLAATDDTVAAGASATVSWFPRVAAAAGPGASPGVEWANAKRETAFTVTAANTVSVAWATFKTADSTVFSLSNPNGANTGITVAQAGVCVTTAELIPAEPAAYPLSCFLLADNDISWGSSNANFLTDSGATLTPAGQFNNPRDYRVSVFFATPCTFEFRVHNLDVANHNMAAAYITILWWPNATLWS